MKRKLLAFVLAGTMIAQNGLLTYASDLVVQSDTEVSDFGSEETVSDVQEETAEPEDEVDSSEQEEVLPNEEEKEEISGDDPLEDVITEGEEPAEEEENISDEFGTGEDETQQEPQELFGDGEEKPEEFSAGEEEILPAAASADDLVYGDLTYRVNNNKVTITGYKGSGTSAVIPVKIGSYEVKEIADRAFSGCGTLESISLPEGLERIGYQFIANTGITSLTVPSTVTRSGCAYVGSGYVGATAGAMELQEVKEHRFCNICRRYNSKSSRYSKDYSKIRI